MTVGIVGLGLIGGSFAKAYKQEGHTVLVANRDASTLELARMSGCVDGALDKSNYGKCDLIILSRYPDACIDWLREAASDIPANTVVMDACGIKRKVCDACFEIAREHGFSFVGGHPMAGTQFSGFKHSRASLFRGASMIIVPESADNISFLERVTKLLEPAGFGRITLATAEQHDEMIAFTSQMAHVVSNAFIKSPCARKHKGFSAGSFKDLTRVAWLNEDMWTELFMENDDNLINELNGLIDALSDYRDALRDGDSEKLHRLLAEGKRIKEELEPGLVRS